MGYNNYSDPFRNDQYQTKYYDVKTGLMYRSYADYAEQQAMNQFRGTTGSSYSNYGVSVLQTSQTIPVKNKKENNLLLLLN